MLIDRVADLELFARVVKEGSLAAAGRALGFSGAVVTKRLQRLEGRLGARLLQRSTRRLSLTEEGARFHEHCLRVLAELEEAEEALSGDASPRGTLRVTAPAAFGRKHVAPRIPEFLRRHPRLRLSLHLSDAVSDIIDEGFDVAIRIGERADSNLVGRVLAPDRRVVVATPRYLELHGEPATPEALADHNCLLFGHPAPEERWRFTAPDGGERSVRVGGNFDASNCEAIREVVLADLGIALRPTWDVWQEIRSGEVKVLLPGYRVPGTTIQALYPSRRQLSGKVRLFIDHLREGFGETPYWDALS